MNNQSLNTKNTNYEGTAKGNWYNWLKVVKKFSIGEDKNNRVGQLDEDWSMTENFRDVNMKGFSFPVI